METLHPDHKKSYTGESPGNHRNFDEHLLPEMCTVESGEFYCKNQSGRGIFIRKQLEHQVIMKAFRMARYPVTQGLWTAVTGINPSFFTGERLPVENVSWNDVNVFILQLNQITGKKYRLPTEAEWQYAAAGGNRSKGFIYSGSDILEQVGWFVENASGSTHEVGMKAPNELGLYDMSGNVWEWCKDWYQEHYLDDGPVVHPKGPETGTEKVYRGGAWNREAVYCTVHNRCRNIPSYFHRHLGFRLVLDEKV
ncbi:MAG: SUMF1/EgtB/PvdO family nonheme iron enzyme [Bacteroidales bacterium]|nr:SUMF1/EgtB/PvdO family nonheme iron enzyme [Bacteroidales bacterium]MDD3962279.1 SUMF1/EgtB/PvdO family nonheme iron enzyme [Bacteroidales bacterium]